MLKFLLTALLMGGFFFSFSQQKFTLNGYIKEASSGEELIGVNVYIPQLKAGTVTNDYGFYAINVPAGTYEVQYSFLGFITQTVTIDLNSDLNKNIQLEEEISEMQEIVVTDRAIDENVMSVQMSKTTLNLTQIKKLPAFMGEVDIIKNIQMMPGVISAGEGTSAFFVRGGSADQNLILIDEAPVYDPSHLFGLYSVFNADVIKDTELYRGGIPARFGGRLSSILDVRTKDGNNKSYEVEGGLGLFASRLAFQGPIVKDKSSFIVSARRSYADVFLRLANEDNLVHFYDINAKVNLKHNNSNRFFVAFYAGRDVFNFGENFGFAWGNMTGTFRWNHLFNERLFMNTSVIASQFDYKLALQDAVQGFQWTSNLREFSVKNDLSYAVNPNNEITFGYHITGREFSPGTIAPNTEGSIFETLKLSSKYAIDHGLYVSNQLQLTPKLVVDYGVRLSVFQNVGKGDVYLYEDPKENVEIERIDTLHFKAWENIKTYINAEPRVGLRYSLNSEQSIKLSYNRMVQNTHLMASGTVPVPFNTWNPSDYYLEPQLADQIAGGYFRNFKDNMYEASVEVYYKDIQNVTDFADNASLFFNDDLSTEFRQGKSWAYGAEFLINKKQGDFFYMASYTWSKSLRKVEDVNQGKPFYSNHDRRNVVNLQAAYDFSPKWTFGATFVFNTGRPLTLAAGKFEYGPYNPDIITERNTYRLPDYHRLDLSVTLNPLTNRNKKWKGQWVFSVYNVYNRKNPFTVYTRTKVDENGDPVGDGTQKEARMIYLFPILPAVTYNFKF